jgi:hypothetical protein
VHVLQGTDTFLRRWMVVTKCIGFTQTALLMSDDVLLIQ